MVFGTAPRLTVAARAQARTNRSIDGFLEGHPQGARPPLEEAGKIIVERQRRSHADAIDAMRFDVKASPVDAGWTTGRS